MTKRMCPLKIANTVVLRVSEIHKAQGKLECHSKIIYMANVHLAHPTISFQQPIVNVFPKLLPKIINCIFKFQLVHGLSKCCKQH